MIEQTLLPEHLERVEKKSGLVAIVGFILLIASFFIQREHFFQSYLTGYLFALGGTLGSVALLCIIHLAGGKWGFLIRRVLESGTQSVWIMGLLFLPILFLGMEDLYAGWLHPETDHHHIVPLKGLYLNYKGFVIRYVLYFVIWGFIARCLYRWSIKQDETGDLKYRRKLKFLAGPALLTYTITMTFASVDWAMSMTPTWFSSIYGVIFMVGQGLTVWAVSIIMLTWMSKWQPVKEELTIPHLHNLGKLLFAFVMLWAYMEVSQFIIIWSANLPEEVPWLLNRSFGGIKLMSLLLVLFQFAIPFLILLSQKLKKQKGFMFKMAVWILVMRIVDLNWIIGPSIHQPITNPDYAGQAIFTLMDVVAPVAFGALWFTLMLRTLRKNPVLPTKDPIFSTGYTQEVG